MFKKNYPFSFLLICVICLFPFLFYSCDDEPTEEPVIEEPDPDPDEPKSEARISTFWIYKKDNPALKEDIRFTVDDKTQIITGVNLWWNESETPDQYVASFNTQKAKEVLIGNIEQTSAQTINSFKEPLTYTLKDEERGEIEYTVILIAPQINSTLPVFRIEPEGEVVDKKNYIPSKMEILGTDEITEGLWDFSKKTVDVRLRGNSTMGLPKKPYRIKFQDKYSPLGVTHTEAKSWVLLANDCDKTLLRTAIAFEMSRYLFKNRTDKFDETYTIPYTQTTIHVDLYMNGKYEGIYHFSDHNQQADGRIAVDKLNAKSADDDYTISGGYIMEVDIHANGGDFTTFYSDHRVKMTHKYPEDDDYKQSQYDYIRAHINKAEAALYDGKGDWKNYFDLETAINFMLINEFCADPDAYTSIWMYKRRGCDKLFFGPIWDFDSAFDNDNRIGNAVNRMMLEASFPCETEDHWFKNFYYDGEFRRLVKERWNSVKDDLKAIVYRVIEEDTAKMGHSLTANFTRWKVSEQALDTAMPGPSSYEAGLQNLKDFVEKRYQMLDREFNK